VLRRHPKEEERSLLSSPQCRRRRSSNSYDNNKRPEARLPSSTCTCAPPIRTFAPMTPMGLHVLAIPWVRRVCRLRVIWMGGSDDFSTCRTTGRTVCKPRHTDVIDDVFKERSGNASLPRHPYIRTISVRHARHIAQLGRYSTFSGIILHDRETRQSFLAMTRTKRLCRSFDSNLVGSISFLEVKRQPIRAA
jgi:hypothetical protein